MLPLFLAPSLIGAAIVILEQSDVLRSSHRLALAMAVLPAAALLIVLVAGVISWIFIDPLREPGSRPPARRAPRQRR